MLLTSFRVMVRPDHSSTSTLVSELCTSARRANCEKLGASQSAFLSRSFYDVTWYNTVAVDLINFPFFVIIGRLSRD